MVICQLFCSPCSHKHNLTATSAVWSTGFVLENVTLKLESFEYLQLPFAISEGCIGQLKVQVGRLRRIAWTTAYLCGILLSPGIHPLLSRLKLQVPLLALRSRAFVVHLSGIKLVAQPRPDADWDMGALGSGARQLSCQSELACPDSMVACRPSTEERALSQACQTGRYGAAELVLNSCSHPSLQQVQLELLVPSGSSDHTPAAAAAG